jgi:small-conductance mechanosensitive channel
MRELFQEAAGWLGYLPRDVVLSQLLVMFVAVAGLGFVQQRWPVSGIIFWVRRWVQILVLVTVGIGLAVFGYPFRLLLELVACTIIWHGVDSLKYFFAKCKNHSELYQLQSQVIRPFAMVFCLFILLRSVDSPENLALIPLGHQFGGNINIGDLSLALSVTYFSLVATGPLAKLLAQLIQLLLVSSEGTKKATAVIIRYLLMAMGLLWSVRQLGVTSTALIAVASGLSFGIGFGVKEIASDFISGIWVLLEGSVRPGAKLSFNGDACEVRSQNLRATILWRERDNAEVVIPNLTFFTDTTITYPSNEPVRRCEVLIPVPPDQKPSTIMSLIEHSASSIDGVLRDPSPQALLISIGDTISKVSSIYAVRFMINNPIKEPQISSAVQAAIWQVLSADGLASLRNTSFPLSPQPPLPPGRLITNPSKANPQRQESRQFNQGFEGPTDPPNRTPQPASPEEELVEKLRRIEALFAQSGSVGERVGSDQPLERFQSGGPSATGSFNQAELRFTLEDQWSRHLFVALMRRYGIRPYRYRGQRHTTVMARLNRSFVNDILWPEFLELQSTLAAYFDALTDRVIDQALEVRAGEAEVQEQKQNQAARLGREQSAST